MQRFLCGLFALQALLSMSGVAVASVDDTLEQVEDAGEEPLSLERDRLKRRRYPPVRLTLNEELEWGDFSGTDVTTSRTSAKAEVLFPITGKFFGSLSSRYGITATDFNGNKDFFDVPGRTRTPWEALHDFSLRLRTQYVLNDSWSLGLAAWTSSRFENGTSFSDGMKGAGAFAVNYRLGDKFGIAAGLAVSSRIVDDGARVSPIGQAYWNIDERHRLSTSGLGLQLRSRWTGEISTFVYGRYSGRRWRLDDHGEGIVNRGSLRDRKVPIGVGLRWKFRKGWRLRADLGLVAYRVFKVTNEENDSISTETANAPGVFGGLLLQRRF
jgi:hypothetical protein